MGINLRLFLGLNPSLRFSRQGWIVEVVWILSKDRVDLGSELLNFAFGVNSSGPLTQNGGLSGPAVRHFIFKTF